MYAHSQKGLAAAPDPHSTTMPKRPAPSEHAPAQSGALCVSVGHYSDAGRKPANQDFCDVHIPDGEKSLLKGVAAAIADGISSSPRSREAAEIAVKSLIVDYYCTPDTWTVKTSVSRVIAATNSWLHAQNRHRGVFDPNQGLVSTLSALILKGAQAHIFHIGDSRIYRVSKNSLEPLTEDHRRFISDTENYLGRAMGAEPQVEIDYRCEPVVAGDTFLLTTDGVHDYIDPAAVTETLDREQDLNKAAQQIAALASGRGSPDNLTIQIIRVENIPYSDDIDILDFDLTLPIPGALRSGDSVDGYRIIRTLHSTSRSHVYLATAPGGSKAAIKVPATEYRNDPDYLRHFALEEWIMRRIRNDHVLRGIDTPQSKTALYIATEYVEGYTLRQWLADNPKPGLDRSRAIVDQIIRGLRAFHRLEMLHQDLRPENIMIDADGTVKIIDVGSARVAGVHETAPAMAGARPGTFQYTAPEYLSGDSVSWRSDQFSLAVIAYELLTGRLPYGTQVAKIRSRMDQQNLVYRSACDDRTGVSGWVDDALQRALHPDPLHRYDALSEFYADLCRPRAGYATRHHIPLARRNPVRFWQSVSAVLAVIVVVLLLRLAGQ